MTDIEKWLNSLKDDDKSINTIVSYENDVNEFMDFTQKEVEDITKIDIDNYKNYIKDKELTIKTLNRKLSSINSFFRFLKDDESRDIDVVIKVEKTQKHNYLEHSLSKYDFQSLVEAAESKNDLRAVAIFYTLYLTGMRVSEALSLKVSDVNRNNISIKGKGSKHREVFMPKRLRDILLNYLNVRINRDTPYLFTSKTGKTGQLSRKTVDAIIKKYAILAGVDKEKAHAHNFRHLYCMSLIEKGISIDTVADLAGHSDINTTRIYTRKTKEQLLDTINNL
ncbi:tyrosine-type recombinase/integrase [uncultured Clostridium sp.]|uniref:tyrosine-type recombinase/integrase n=1 Tax=uncultured Clostridium sp. TaxID=59620 RepID=UPI0025D961C0|nr:tyrosine-type recombinase/integrase [uncultured Clostridium sp.]